MNIENFLSIMTHGYKCAVMIHDYIQLESQRDSLRYPDHHRACDVELQTCNIDLSPCLR